MDSFRAYTIQNTTERCIFIVVHLTVVSKTHICMWNMDIQILPDSEPIHRLPTTKDVRNYLGVVTCELDRDGLHEWAGWPADSFWLQR